MYQIATSDGSNYALKLYNLHRHPNHEVLQAIKSAPRGNGLLIDLYDFGIWTSPEGNRHDYELMPFYTGGSLASLRPLSKEKDGAATLKKIALRMAAEIAYCHEQNVLHRDIKPANFLYDGDDIMSFVLTDFGIGKIIGPDGQAIIDDGRTPIYAAPENYIRIGGRDPHASAAADFYSMGMTLLALWMGEGNLFADEEQNLNDKQNETLPYPQKKEIGHELLSLIKALTRFNVQKRATFEDIERWAQGEDVFAEKEPEKEFRAKFANEIAHSPAELARMMWEPQNQKRAIDYLYQDEVRDWLRAAELNDLSVVIHKITENLYAARGEELAGLYAACLTLDESMGYTTLDGREIFTAEEIAEELTRKESSYTAALANKMHPLWIYLSHMNEQKIAKEFPDRIKSMGVRGVRWLTYVLDPRLPFRVDVSYGKETKKYSISDLNQLYTQLATMNNRSGLIAELAEEDFISWLYARNQQWGEQAEISIMQASDISDSSTALGYAVAFGLGQAYGFDFKPIKESSVASLEQIARQAAHEISNGDTGPGTIAGMLGENFSRTILHIYMDLRGNMDKHIDWINSCVNLYSSDNSKKLAPYTEDLARMKAVAGLLGGKFPLEIGGVTIQTLSDYEKNRSKVDAAAKGTKQQLLQDWMALQHQENPSANLSGGRYTQLAKDYVNALMKYIPDCGPAQRARRIKDKIADARADYHRATGSVKGMQALVILLGFLPLAAISGLIIYHMFFNVESESFRGMMEGIGNILGWIVGIGGGLALCAANPIAGIIGGIGLYYLTAWLVGLLTPLVPWFIIGVLVIIMIIFATITFDKTSHTLTDSYSPGSDLNEAEERAIYADAFDNRDTLLPNLPADYPATVYTDCAKNIRDTLSARKSSTVIMIVVSAVIMGIFYWAMDGNIFGSGSSSANTEINASVPMVAGNYAGTFDGREATMTLLQSSDGTGNVEGNIYIKYRKELHHHVAGSFAKDEPNRLVLFLLNSDGSRDESVYYIGTVESFDSGVHQLSGQYYNNHKGSKHDFSFTLQE